jgi:hypothetical protein
MKNHQPSNIKHQLPMKLTDFTYLAFRISRIIDAAPDPDLAFHEILDAGSDGKLIKLVAARYCHLTDFSYLLSKPAVLQQMEAALCDATAGFRCGGDKPTSPVSGLCLVMDIVIEASQQRCAAIESKNKKSIITHCSKGFKGFLGVFRNYIFRRLITH